MKRIKWVIFDFDEVISPTHNWYNIVLEEINKKVKIDLQKGFKFFKENATKWFIDEWNEKKFLKELNNHLKTKISYKFFDVALDKTLSPEKEIVEVMDSLRKKGYKIGLLTDNPKIKIEKINSHKDIKNLFDHASGSGILNLRKKEGKQIFEKLLAKLNIFPEEVIFIDDTERNCKFAEEAGIKSINFVLGKNNKKRLLKSLNSFSIKL